jgi:hypothetical protein
MYFIVFILLLTGFCLVGKNKTTFPIRYSIILGLFIRLGIMFVFYKSSSNDLTSFLDAGKIILEKKLIYPSLYFPFFSYLGALAVFLKGFFPPLLFLKLILLSLTLGTFI